MRGLVESLKVPLSKPKEPFLRENDAQEMTQNSWHWQKSAQFSEIFVKSRGICQSVGVSSREGEHFPFWTKMVRTKIKPGIHVPLRLKTLCQPS